MLLASGDSLANCLKITSRLGTGGRPRCFVESFLRTGVLGASKTPRHCLQPAARVSLSFIVLNWIYIIRKFTPKLGPNLT